MKHPYLLLMAAAAALATASASRAENKAPVIDHSPVKIAVRGQNVVVRARITDDAGPVKEATLFVAVSRDAAPIRIAMQDTGGGIYAGTLSSELLGGLDRLQYYIDAVDSDAMTTETPWVTLEIKSPEPGKTTPLAGTAPPASPESKRPAWVKPALIAGGVLVAGGAALALSGGGGGGGSSSGGGSATNSAGTYSGSQTTCFQPPSASTTCASGSFTIAIDANGNVSSDSLYPGQQMTGHLSGANFVLVANVQQQDRNGQVQYVGTVVDTRIVGSIQGSAQTSAGDGTYSGTFSAVKR